MTERQLSKAATTAKPTLATVGNHTFIANGRWNYAFVADHICEQGPLKWISVGQLAKIACGGNNIPNKRKVRARLSGLFNVLLDRRLFLAIEYSGKHNSATAVKVADLNSEQDRQKVEVKLNRMRQRREMTEEVYERAMRLLRGASNGGNEG